MKRRILWLVFSCLMALSLVLASCAAAEVEEEEEVVTPGEEEVVTPEEEEVVAPPEGPQYGGLINFIIGGTQTDVFDPHHSSLMGPGTVLLYEPLLEVDWSKGPSGTNETPFDWTHPPDEIVIGCLLESWERPDPQTFIGHIRKGVHFHRDSVANGRELTAEDIMYSSQRANEYPQYAGYISPDTPEEERTKWTIIDKYTYMTEAGEEQRPDPDWLTGLMWFKIIPLEAEQIIEESGDLMDWTTVCGTGPYTVLDVVSASSVTYQRNPNYWQYDPLHPENRLPYVETIKGLVIEDESTALAALRTGKIDRGGVSWEKVEGLRKTNPEILLRKVLPSGARVIFMRTDLEPFSDVKVRQALSLAIDQEAMARDFYRGEALLLTWPIQPTIEAIYTPLEKLPENLRELFEYHPEKAKQLLAEAGYPDGLKTEVIVTAAASYVDVMSIVKEYFADVGVDMEIRPLEAAVFGGTIYGRRFPAMAYTYWGNPKPAAAFGWAHGGVPESVFAFSKVVNPAIEEKFDLWSNEPDRDERNRIIKEENLYEIEMCYEIPLPSPYGYLAWQPWLKGYSGEYCTGPTWELGINGIYKYVWLDTEMRYKMTGRE